MRGLLIALCALATTAATLAGGCAFLFTGLVAAGAPNNADRAAFLAITGPVLAVTAAVVFTNIALITALSRGRAPRRNVWFLLLAIVDLAVAAALGVAGITGRGPVAAGTFMFLLPCALAIKGLLTFLLPAEPPALPPAASRHGGEP